MTADLLAQHGLVPWVVTDDEVDGTVVVATWPGMAVSDPPVGVARAAAKVAQAGHE